MDLDALAVVVRAVLYIDLLTMFGFAVFGISGMQSAKRAVSALCLRGWFAGMAVLGLLVSTLQIAVMAASMAGLPLTLVSGDVLEKLVDVTLIGTAWKVRMAALFAMVPVSFLVPRMPRAALALATALSGIAVATFAWAGHGVMNSGVIGWLHLGADVVHLLAAGAWIGAIAVLCMLLFDGRVALDAERLSLLYRALKAFASTGTVIVGLILLTGILNLWIIVGLPNVLSLPNHAYGRLLLVKIALFVAMLCLAAGNRFRLSPALGRVHEHGDPQTALTMLRVSLATEAGCALTILAIAAWLGTLAPSGH
jgi:putative copper resistance protein D